MILYYQVPVAEHCQHCSALILKSTFLFKFIKYVYTVIQESLRMQATTRIQVDILGMLYIIAGNFHRCKFLHKFKMSLRIDFK